MKATVLRATDRLPLTCTRAGTCCHGKAIWLNPWELRRLADARGESVAAFLARDTVDGGIRLRMDGPAGWRSLPACSQYAPDQGCTVHGGRPLACRLYPLGRQVDATGSRYLHEGKAFPCRAGCPEVDQLPALTVRDYLHGQSVAAGETAQDGYRNLVADLGEGAFVLWQDSALAGDAAVLAAWHSAAAAPPSMRPNIIGSELLEWIQAPMVPVDPEDAAKWVEAHRTQVQAHAQATFAGLRDPGALQTASVQLFTAALHLAQANGGDAAALAQTWLNRGRSLAKGPR